MTSASATALASTVVVVNVDPLARAHSLELPLSRPNTGQFRRRTLPTPLKIPAYGQVDLCAVLGVSLIVARELTRKDPIAEAVRRGRLAIIENPPPLAAITIGAVASPAAPEVALATPDGAEMPLVDTATPVAPATTPVPADATAVALALALPELPDALTTPAVLAPPAALMWPEGVPSMDWKLTELRAYAEAQGLSDLNRAGMSKVNVLRAIHTHTRAGAGVIASASSTITNLGPFHPSPGAVTTVNVCMGGTAGGAGGEGERS